MFEHANAIIESGRRMPRNCGVGYIAANLPSDWALEGRLLCARILYDQTERWATIPGHPKYEVSNNGRVHGPRGLLHPNTNLGNGYPAVHIGSRKYYVHRLVAAAFCPPPLPGQTQVNHINFDPEDNRARNLEWVTPRENIRHSRPNMRHPHPNAPLPSTGERYVIRDRGRYRVRCGPRPHQYYGTLAEAVAARDELMTMEV